MESNPERLFELIKKNPEIVEKFREAAENSICFDAEPLLAYYWDTEGSEIVEDYFAEILQGDRFGYVSDITYCEVKYHLLREDSKSFFYFREFLSDTIELEAVPSDRTWSIAADIKGNHSLALGDAFSIATAVSTDSTLIVGADDDFDQVEEAEIEQIRTIPD